MTSVAAAGPEARVDLGSALPADVLTAETQVSDPADVELPTITGNPIEGETLSASAGTWTENPAGFAFQWQDCNSAGEACLDIAGAGAPTYALTDSDLGDTVRVAVTATNTAGSGEATSAQTEAVTPDASPPTETSPPAITGVAEEGQTLSATAGVWTGSPTGFSYQWQDCNTTGEACSDITGASTSTYKLTATDVGQTIRVTVTATNAGGSAEAPSSATSTVLAAPAAPSNTELPAISGTTEEGQTLTATHGTWTESPTGYTYQWQDCNSTGEGCTNITGEPPRPTNSHPAMSATPSVSS